ncbi:ABC transporter, partial [Halolamina salina]
LDRAGVETTVGPVPAGDSDAAVADALGIEAVEFDAFGEIDAATLDQTAEYVTAADAVIVADVDLTDGLVPVFDRIGELATPVYAVEERSLAERTVSQAAAERYRSLRGSEAGVAASAPELLESLT